jgi:prenylcysteine alpha-carboxyl methylesterase
MLEFLLMLASMVLHVLDQAIAMARLVVYHALVCVRNARKLWSMLVRGTQTWVIMLGRLVLFTILLAPGWYQLLKYFFFNPFILRNVEYGLGSKFRNVMDIYLPIPPSYNRSASKKVRHHTLTPVVIFVSGGAWMIGYKLWSALVGRGLAALGYLVIVPDYRNFPQGDIEVGRRHIMCSALTLRSLSYI